MFGACGISHMVAISDRRRLFWPDTKSIDQRTKRWKWKYGFIALVYAATLSFTLAKPLIDPIMQERRIEKQAEIWRQGIRSCKSGALGEALRERVHYADSGDYRSASQLDPIITELELLIRSMGNKCDGAEKEVRQGLTS